MQEARRLVVLAVSICWCLSLSAAESVVGVEEEWGEGLKVLRTYVPQQCEFRAQNGDVIHYHYVGRLDDGTEFGKSFDYNTPYIVALGRGRIIRGMDRGLVDMCLWERRRVTIPPHLGYGEVGVGETIPPQSTLVFYVRLIKIERDGVQLQKDTSLDDLWYSAMDAYRESNWQTVVDQIEEAIQVFDAYQNATLPCLQNCSENDTPDLSDEERETVGKYAGEDDQVTLQFLTYAARARCVRECKAANLTPNKRYPNPSILKRFRRREPYSFLHFAYYQLDNYEEGAKCFFTFMFHNPESELVKSNVDFYRKTLKLGSDEFVWRETPILPHQDRFLAGVKAYEKESYLEAVDLIESALPLYIEALRNCELLCEDLLVMNITEPNMSAGMRAVLDHYMDALEQDTLDYHSVMAHAIRELLECRVHCHSDLARVQGDALEDYLPHHFHYLQFAYYKLGQLLKAAEAAATYLGMVPSDEVMLHNVRYYTNQYKLQPEDFVPRDEYVAITDKLATENRLLYFAEHGEPKKKQGQRGDGANHEEL